MLGERITYDYRVIIGISQGKSFIHKLIDPGHAFVMYIDVNNNDQRTFLNCANAASTLLKSTGLFENIKNHSTPKGLLKDLNNYYENHKESVIKKEYDFSTGELINE